MTQSQAPQVRRNGIPFELSPLGECALGDVVGLPDGKTLTVRSIAVLEQPVHSMAGFVMLGECEMLIGAPSRVRVPHAVYLPVGSLAAAKGARVAVEGVCSYWAPHLPAVTAAMAELPFRVLDVPGQLEPWVVIHRGPEVLVFVRTKEMDGASLQVTRMPRAFGQDEIVVVRHAATVEPLPHQIPAPSAIPVAQPVQEPVAVPVR